MHGMREFAYIILSKTRSDIFNWKTEVNIFASLAKADDNPEERKRIIYNRNISTQELVKMAESRLENQIKK
jgi:hypothetical protein